MGVYAYIHAYIDILDCMQHSFVFQCRLSWSQAAECFGATPAPFSRKKFGAEVVQNQPCLTQKKEGHTYLPLLHWQVEKVVNGGEKKTCKGEIFWGYVVVVLMAFI